MTPPVLLVLDYPGRRDEPMIADLQLETAGYDVHYLLRDPLPRAVTAARYAAELVDRSDVTGREIAAVLAFCMAAPIAQDVARLVDAPTLLCFDGEPSTEAAVESEYRGVRAPFGAPRLPDWWDRAELAARPDGVLERIADDLTTIAVEALAADGLGEMAEELTATYVDWLSHLIAAHHATFPAWGGDVLHVASRDHPIGDAWPGAVRTRTVRLPVTRRNLLCHEETRLVALDLLAGAGGAP